MVLDEYYQVYIGTTNDIKKRIGELWRKSKTFDRLLFPMRVVDSSILSIHSFRAIDTTRIFAYKTNRTFNLYNKFLNQFGRRY